MYNQQPNTSKAKELPGIHGAHGAVRASSNGREAGAGHTNDL